MFSRFIHRSVLPCLYKITKTTARTSKQHSVDISVHTPATCFTNVGAGHRRFYSQQAATENMSVVDFEYVQKATKNNDILIVDVREPDELKEHGTIPNSINIPLGTITTTLSQMPEKEFQLTFNKPKPAENTEIIFYCMIGKRSGKAQENAQKLGYTNVKNYLGSFTDWAAKTKV